MTGCFALAIIQSPFGLSSSGDGGGIEARHLVLPVGRDHTMLLRGLGGGQVKRRDS